MIRKDQLNCDTKHLKTMRGAAVCKGSPRMSFTQLGAIADCIGSRLTLPKLHLATSKLIANR